MTIVGIVTTPIPWLALRPWSHRVSDLAHLGHWVRSVDKRSGCVAAGDHHMLAAGPGGEGGHDGVGVDPSPVERMG